MFKMLTQLYKIRRLILEIAYKNNLIGGMVQEALLLKNHRKNSELKLNKVSELLELKKRKILIIGPFLSFGKGLTRYFNAMHLNKDNFIVLNTARPRKLDKNVQNYIGELIQLPHLFENETFFSFKRGEIKHYPNEFKNKYRDEIKVMVKKYNFMRQDHIYDYLYYCEILSNILEENQSLKEIYLWNEFLILNRVIKKNISRKKIFFMEHGLVPGTLCIEKDGQIDSSYFCSEKGILDFNEFCKKDFDKKIQHNAQGLLKWLRDMKINRLSFKNKRRVDIKKIFCNSLPTYLVVGQNDFESNLSFNLQQNPNISHFKSSLELLKYCQEIQKNKFNILYKPHPKMKQYEKREISKSRISDKTFVIYDDVDINHIIDAADATITISSSTSFISLIRGKNVFLTGLNELSYKKICYESNSKEEFAENIDLFTKKRRYKYFDELNFLKIFTFFLKSENTYNFQGFMNINNKPQLSPSNNFFNN